MTIKSILELQLQADTTIEDNTSGLITASDVRTLFNDILDTLSPAYGQVLLTSLVKAVNTTPSKLSPFNSAPIATPGFYAASAANGEVTRYIATAGIAGATDFVIVQGSVTGSSNGTIRVSLYKNGVDTGWSVTVNCTGNTEPISFNIAALNYTASVDATYSLYITAIAATDNGNYTFTNTVILAQAQAVRSFA